MHEYVYIYVYIYIYIYICDAMHSIASKCNVFAYQIGEIESNLRLIIFALQCLKMNSDQFSQFYNLCANYLFQSSNC